MQDISNYTKAYYLRDQTFARYGVLRPDQLAALCYALNWPYWGFEVAMGEERYPGHILSIGCGRGELEKQLESMGFTVTGVDPSSGAQELYQGSTLVPAYTEALVRSADTVLFCESIEHLPLEQINEIFGFLNVGTRVVITNFIEYFPIIPTPEDGWDHITQVDDELYDRLGAGRTVILRKASHLVLE